MKTGQSWINSKLEVRGSSVEGSGIFAKETIDKGERLAIFGGSVMRIDELEHLPPHMQALPMQIEERFVFGNATSEPEDTDYFNHNCEPNAGFRGQIFLVAMQNIEKGEEITFDYAMIISESIGNESEMDIDMDCLCGAKHCRGRITENDWKLPELRKKYDGYFSEYIAEKIRAEK